VKTSRGRISHWLLDLPVLWGALGFAVYFYYAQFIRMVGWNAIELIIAQHLLEHGAYVTSLDYPSALTWRPLLPTLMVTFVRLWTADPMLIYQIICGSALGSLAAMMFLSAKIIWGRLAGHLAAFFTLACPAITTGLINHFHSYSHLGGLLLLGPAIYCSLVLLQDRPPGAPARRRLYVLSGLLWSLAYLCRSELLLFFGVNLLALSWLHFRERYPIGNLAACLVAFLAVFIPYNIYAEHVAHRDGLKIRKSIYGFYMSQGWSDPPPNVGPDIEAEGYAYAIKLYGTPLANGESAIRAFSNNLPAFWRRVRLNTQAFYRAYSDPAFFGSLWGTSILLLAGLLACGLVPAEHRLAICLLFLLFCASHFVLIYHIDLRYLTVGVPPLLLLMTGCVHYLLRWIGKLPRLIGTGLTIAALIGVVCASKDQWGRLRNHAERNTRSILAMQSLGAHFRTVVTQPRLVKNREPHIGFETPEPSPVYGEDFMLLDYFSHSAYVNHGAEGAFPRGVFYSFRECDDDYRYVPEARLAAETAVKGVKVIADYQNPVLGRYFLLQMNP
jgi:hypothetical protein